MSKENILIINCGSSSLKFAVINPSNGDEIISGIAERLGEKESFIRWKFEGNKESITLDGGAHDAAVAALLHMLEEKGLKEGIAAVGHRVVHGGETFQESCLITEEVIQGIKDCIHLAPLHNPANLTGIEAAQKHFPELPMSVVFDTSFHQTMPAEAYTYAVPYKFYSEKGLRRYGMHGTSYRFVSQRVCEMLGMEISNSKIVIAHLGNGASCAAVLNGESVDTTMGLTPLEGLVMGTRSGNVDPNVFSFLNKEYGYSLDEITDILNKKSGLLGISELSNDCRVVEEAAAEGHKQATLALDVFCYVLAKQLAGMAVATGGVDALAFTGGIGENSDLIRAKVVKALSFLGFDLDEEKNLANRFGNEGVISTDGSRATALVVSTNEELMIAQDTAALIA
ncbi:acetate kinase [Parendozoicomonas haliclonae]|uniref:Acetate kinase n=1 Tax=Parendozoicomonas haliclonae TaxID=1960125 RepID=A0A1X7ALD2_9GAMM|nr:acetate kinase [Parendozoicomonas haliclonae]SMA48684.1 Acetate kinase [Parendozoicomonas haliclonae]